MATSIEERARRLAVAVAMAIAVPALVSCGAGGGSLASSGGALSPGLFRGVDGATAAVEPSTLPVCGTGAHDRHTAMNVACAGCHPCGGIYGFADPVTYAGGTSSANGTLVRANGTTTCSVGCHAPLGATSNTVTWSTPGPLACSACHSNVAPATQTYRSAHAVAQTDPVQNRAACQSCHDTSLHTGGHVRIDMGDGTIADASVTDPAQMNAVCQGCHDGSGRTISGMTPPPLVGWTDSASGDFHGSRAGAGFGGTLLAPFSVGQAPLACTSCHDPHASTNSFLFAASVNGAPVFSPSGPIDRAGVGAEALCMNCHQGNRHAGCMISNCHTSDPVPAPAPCFFCHGHEGIVNFTLPTWDNHPNATGNYCNHCHSNGWYPATVRYTPPVITIGNLAVTASSATISWGTDENATSYVEYGTSTLGTVTGDWATPTTGHQITIQGLSELTTYSFRVRSSDAFRNVAESPVATFTTSSAYAPPAPTLAHQPGLEYDASAGTAGVPSSYAAVFLWSAVAAPTGDPVQYQFQLSNSPTFSTTIRNLTLTTNTTTVALPVNQYPTPSYYWRVQAADALQPAYASPWSATDVFDVYWWSY